jgi:transcriptional regulator with XRE-family HTH domain
MELKNLAYNGRDVIQEGSVMPKRKMQLKEKGDESFGERLARLRKAAGFSQRELAAELGISYRMVAYYEGETEHPPTHLLPHLAKALGVSADELMGLEKSKKNGRTQDTRLWRRFSQVEKLPPPKRKQIVQILDAFLGSEKAKKTG